ncbi:hypothetical protein SAMN05421789_107141 [Kaistella chaponensis]|uniref:Uncharacterized protein n=1 Tax=Kaistella chaponensis TaxID=713588 RepID=A0A1N7M6T1_9FLAO|nr:hypothetical protein [Kaistella chaponensis]SIS81681.1 hypothetical protein SAMN05421789_107141 [Kaistella chaponensis]
MKTLQRILMFYFLSAITLYQAQQNERKGWDGVVKGGSISFGYNTTQLNSATKDAYILNSSGISADAFIPFSLFRKGWDGTVKGGSFGFNIGGTFYFENNENPSSPLPSPLNISGQTNTEVSYKTGASGQSGFRIGAGPQMNFNLGERFIFSPMIIAEYFSLNRNALSVLQNSTVNGKPVEYTLWTLPETKTSGLAITPKIRAQYFFTKNFGVFADGAYVFGPKINTQLTSLVPFGKPNQGGQYEQQQVELGTKVTGEVIKTTYNAFSASVGLSYSFGGTNGSGETPTPAKVEINKSRSSIKSQISAKPSDSTGGSNNPEPAKVEINKSRSSIKSQISAKPSDSTGGSNNPEPAKVEINKSRSSIKSQISAKPTGSTVTPKDPSTSNPNKFPQCSCGSFTSAITYKLFGPNSTSFSNLSTVCGGEISANVGSGILFDLSNYVCGPGGCASNIVLDIYLNGNLIYANISPGLFAQNRIAECGTYKIVLKSTCSTATATTQCDNCDIYISVPCVTDCCKGSRWGTIQWMGENNLICGQTIGNKITGSIQTLNYNFTCQPNCPPYIKYDLVDASGNIISTTTAISGTNVNITMPSTEGFYRIIATGLCLESPCTTCIISFKVVFPDPVSCCLNSNWGKRIWTNIGIVNCNTTLAKIFTPGSVQRVNYTFYCNPNGNCTAVIKYKIINQAGTVMSATTANSGQDKDLTMPSTSGTYRLVAEGWCDGVLCSTCVVYFVVSCADCYNVTISPPIALVSGDIANINGTIVGANSSRPLKKVVAQLISFSADKNNAAVANPLPNFEFLSSSQINGSVSVPFSLTMTRSNMIVSNFTTPATGTISYNLKIDKMSLKTVKKYYIKFTLFFADGTNCENYITRVF